MSEAFYLEIQLNGEPFYLLPQKAIYRPLKKQLFFSDIHLGKTTHFRKKGIALPQQSKLKDIDLITSLINHYQPLQIIFLGDLFHSSYNNEWLYFKSLLQQFATLQFILVKGNHDILKDDIYAIKNLDVIDVLEEEQFIFTHYPLENPIKLNFCGHVHPSYTLRGKAKQSITLPCFYKQNLTFMLPAFGNLTGLFAVQKNKKTSIYLITQKMVIEA